MKDHKLADIEFDTVLTRTRLMKLGLFELKAQMVQKRNTGPNQRREMFSEDDLIVISVIDQPSKKCFGLIRNGERFIEKNRLHKSFSMNL
jgi:hypothetical protein